MRAGPAVLAGALVLATVAGCSTTAAHKTTAAPVKSSAGTSSPDPIPTVDPAVTEAPSPDTPSVATIGGTVGFTYDDGLQVFVVSAKRFVRGQYAAGGKPGQVGVLVTVRLKNTSSEVLDATLAQVALTAGANGNQGDTVYDSEAGIGLGFTSRVAPGGTAQAKFGFAVDRADLPKIQVQVTPTFTHDPSLFQGTVS
ncbi:MAG: hypothetical protein ACR2JO_03245 [Mycobacteriales bacterium]